MLIMIDIIEIEMYTNRLTTGLLTRPCYGDIYVYITDITFDIAASCDLCGHCCCLVRSVK